MKPCARHFQRGFTLLEICMVLFIIALLAAVALPSIQNAFTEQALRNDTGQIALMVRTAMLQSTEQHRPYVLEVTATTMSLHPQPDPTQDPDAPPPTSSSNADDDAPPPQEDVVVDSKLDALNKLLTPDPDKKNAWIAMPATSWYFEPGELCPVPRVRMSRGESYVEMSFNALTGNVENETAYFP